MRAIRLELWAGHGQFKLEQPIFNTNVQKRNWHTSEFDETDFLEFKRKICEFQNRSKEIEEMPEFKLVNQLIQEHMAKFKTFVKDQMESHRWTKTK